MQFHLYAPQRTQRPRGSAHHTSTDLPTSPFGGRIPSTRSQVLVSTLYQLGSITKRRDMTILARHVQRTAELEWRSKCQRQAPLRASSGSTGTTATKRTRRRRSERRERRHSIRRQPSPPQQAACNPRSQIVTPPDWRPSPSPAASGLRQVRDTLQSPMLLERTAEAHRSPTRTRSPLAGAVYPFDQRCRLSMGKGQQCNAEPLATNEQRRPWGTTGNRGSPLVVPLVAQRGPIPMPTYGVRRIWLPKWKAGGMLLKATSATNKRPPLPSGRVIILSPVSLRHLRAAAVAT